jgi:hypothetical protein
MKQLLIVAAVIVVAALWVLPTGLMAQDELGSDQGAQSGECYFQASEDIYLKIYNLDKSGVERTAVWEGFLPAGGTKAFNAPYGTVGFATRQSPDGFWSEDQEECANGAAIDIP